MIVPAPCGICFKERQAKGDNTIPIIFWPGRVADEGYVSVQCANGHQTVVLYDERKHDILFHSACHALIAGYEREAVSSFAAALERLYEFFVRVGVRHHQLPDDAFTPTWKAMARQSERQFGAFLTIHLLISGTAYQINQKMVEWRNRVIHQGYIPKPGEAESYGEHVFNQKFALMHLLSDKCAPAMCAEEEAQAQDMRRAAPANVPQIGFKATLVNVPKGSNVAEEITSFQEYLRGVFESVVRREEDILRSRERRRES